MNTSTRCLFAVGFIPFIIISLLALAVNPSIFERISNYANPDAQHYWLLAYNMLKSGSFSRSPVPPFIPDILRTPLYPLFLSCFRLLPFAPMWVYTFQAMLYSLSCIIIYKLVYLISNNAKISLYSYIMMLMNISSYLYCFTTMSEILFIFLVVASLYGLFLWLQTLKITYILFSSLLLGLATLTKPATLYAIIIYCAIIYIALPKNYVKRIYTISVSLIIFLLTLSPWIIRNKIIFDMPRISIVDTNNSIYFLGASPYMYRSSIPLESAWSKISTEYNIPNYPILQNLHLYSDQFPIASYRGLYDYLDSNVKWNVITKYPVPLMSSVLLGFIKCHISHNIDVLSDDILEKKCAWNPSGGSGGSILSKVRFLWSKNSIPLFLFFIYQYIYMFTLYILCIVGTMAIIKIKPKRILIIAYLLLLMYSFINIVGAGMDAYQRFRMFPELFYYLFAGYGIYYILPYFTNIGKGNAIYTSS